MVPQPRVLVVDDDQDNREIVGECLQDRYAVTLAADGARALDLMTERGRDFDLVIVDLEMPRLDGQELVRELRQRAMMLPVLMVSGALDLRERAEEVEVEFIAKPFDRDHLNDKVEKLIRY